MAPGRGRAERAVGAHVVGVFVDFACLHQSPRTEEQEKGFQAALKVMANGCAPPARSARAPPRGAT